MTPIISRRACCETSGISRRPALRDQDSPQTRADRRRYPVPARRPALAGLRGRKRKSPARWPGFSVLIGRLSRAGRSYFAFAPLAVAVLALIAVTVSSRHLIMRFG